MRFHCTVTMDNAAFEEEPLTELGRILFEMGVRIGNGHRDGDLLDVNGNQVGEWRIG